MTYSATIYTSWRQRQRLRRQALGRKMGLESARVRRAAMSTRPIDEDTLRSRALWDAKHTTS